MRSWLNTLPVLRFLYRKLKLVAPPPRYRQSRDGTEAASGRGPSLRAADELINVGCHWDGRRFSCSSASYPLSAPRTWWIARCSWSLLPGRSTGILSLVAFKALNSPSGLVAAVQTACQGSALLIPPTFASWGRLNEWLRVL